MPKTVFGVVAANGSVISGSADFSVLNTSGGVYSISINSPFETIPAVVTTQGGNFPQPNNRDSSVVGILTPQAFTVITGDNEGNFVNRQFSFIAIGN